MIRKWKRSHKRIKLFTMRRTGWIHAHTQADRFLFLSRKAVDKLVEQHWRLPFLIVRIVCLSREPLPIICRRSAESTLSDLSNFLEQSRNARAYPTGNRHSRTHHSTDEQIFCTTLSSTKWPSKSKFSSAILHVMNRSLCSMFIAEDSSILFSFSSRFSKKTQLIISIKHSRHVMK